MAGNQDPIKEGKQTIASDSCWARLARGLSFRDTSQGSSSLAGSALCFSNMSPKKLRASSWAGPAGSFRSTRPGNAERGDDDELAPGSPWLRPGPFPPYEKSLHLSTTGDAHPN